MCFCECDSHVWLFGIFESESDFRLLSACFCLPGSASPPMYDHSDETASVLDFVTFVLSLLYSVLCVSLFRYIFSIKMLSVNILGHWFTTPQGKPNTSKKEGSSNYGIKVDFSEKYQQQQDVSVHFSNVHHTSFLVDGWIGFGARWCLSPALCWVSSLCPVLLLLGSLGNHKLFPVRHSKIGTNQHLAP